jgi:diguanylate cyclase (GGDEF)-like protein
MKEEKTLDNRLILIVDDNKINRTVLSKILKDNYRLIEAADGQEALDLLEDRKGEVSAVFLDLTMPVLDGYEFLKIRQKSKELSSIPVIVQTQKEGVESEIRCLKDGASDFLTKPYNPNLLLHRLANIIKLRENESFISVVQHDSLTGLYNTEGFYAKAEQTINSNPDKLYSVICGDINQFKIISQIYGESVGDDVLRFVGNVLKEVLGEDALVSRFSADRFQALIDYKIDAHKATSQIEKLLQKSPVSNILHLQLGVYSMAEGESISVRSMCDYSRMPIESIKGKYGKVIAFYKKSDYEKLVQEQQIVSRMDKALKDREFVVYYQPKVKVNDGELVGAEALVRWINPELGFMNPGLFIPLFESNGFITKLDKYVWEEACKHQRKWLDKGYNVVPISVNISRNDFYSENLVEFFVYLIDKYNIPASLLHLEITETAYTQGQEKLVTIIKELSFLGFYIEMDDFGSGYSSLNMLSEVSVDMLKLDMAFMMNRAKSDSKKSIIHLVMGIARELDLDVIAEGVETEEDVTYLKTIGCKFAQGYYFARPMPKTDFEKLLTIGSNISNLKVHHLTFSPNGRTLKTGSFIAKKLGEEILHNVTSKYMRNFKTVINKNEVVIISYPTYAGRIPQTFVDYLQSNVKIQGASVILITTYGNREFEDSLLEGEDIIKSLGGKLLGAASVVSEHCYTDKVGSHHPNQYDLLVLDEFATIILSRFNGGHINVEIPGNRPYRTGVTYDKPFFMPELNEDLCIECNKCVNACPTRAMRFNDASRCIHCCACINVCPTQALSFKDDRFLKIVEKLEINCKKIKETQYF